MSAELSEVVLVDQELISAYGKGVACCAEGLLENRRAFRPAGDGFAPALAALPVGAVPAAGAPEPEPASRLLALVRALFADAGPVAPDTSVYVATTVGEIDRLEAEVGAGAAPSCESRLSLLPRRLAATLGVSEERVQVVSSACASSTAALALAASAIRRGETSCALVVGCDLVSEFVLSGFAALMALDPDGAKPFDAERRGVTLGSAAAFALLMSRERAVRERRTCLGVVGGWGMTCDANHLTGPSRDGAPLAEAARAALAMAGCPPEDVAALCAHGTGTVYNDQMELLAFKQLFGGRPLPTFSVKGGMGHTLGAAGVTETLLALEFLRRGRIPPTVGLRHAAQEAHGWVSQSACPVSPQGVVLTTNSGFGGVNAALALALLPFPNAAPPRTDAAALHVAGRGAFSASTGESLTNGAFALPRNFGRFSAESRRAFHAVMQALNEAGLTLDGNRFLRYRHEPAPVRAGVIAFDRDGSAAANRAYYSDYVGSGRVLGRGQLFVYTLPTSVAAECAIACHLTGPLLYVAEPDGGDGAARRAARGLLADGLTDAVVLLSVTSEAAQASVVTAPKRTPLLSATSQS